MELRHLEYFVAVAEERHFTRAADRLLVSQSALSASVRALERELGARLFLRNTRSVALTEAGRALLDEARRTLAGVRAARDAVAAVRGLLRGTLAIGTEQCIGGVDVSRLLARFHELHPGVEIRLRQAGSQPLAEEVAAGRLDLAFVALCGQPPPGGVSLMPLADEPMVLLCRPDHPLGARERVTWQDLGDRTFVDFAPDWGARTLSDRAFAEAGVRRQVALEVNDVHTLLGLIGHGLGIALVPEHITRKPDAGVLSAIPFAGAGAPRWTASVATPAPDRTAPAAQRFLTLLRS
ncbi:LysR family transcriptional regulator [Streptomyces aidingensis]|uniref:DNA-binding transcriptional regulator, LysR family n=1 Tax=Streptomyces aidingensis TaxID=910347 RepID=A0A1I1TLM8_9ACTN|nr:LysR family transcriptional regulator [Streptomyces aidingensis]SFD59424.1 DNA-binding transcriptional regulator, LysR family [Streptomyces aidingensis]